VRVGGTVTVAAAEAARSATRVAVNETMTTKRFVKVSRYQPVDFLVKSRYVGCINREYGYCDTDQSLQCPVHIQSQQLRG
jgi:hypothetical protein